MSVWLASGLVFAFAAMGLYLGFELGKMKGLYEAENRAEREPHRTSLFHYILDHTFWSSATFGIPKATDTQKLLKHIRKELVEIENTPRDVYEWVDVMILAIDGAYRNGHSAKEIATALVMKQRKNQTRTWVIPADPTQPNEHDRSYEERETNP